MNKIDLERYNLIGEKLKNCRKEFEDHPYFYEDSMHDQLNDMEWLYEMVEALDYRIRSLEK